jgi:cytochrome c oxidase subunit 2
MVAFASLLDETATRNVAAYLDTLPEQQRPETTVAGDAERGRELYATCAGCHGADGQGVWTTQAPRLAAMADWYVVRQLNNFRQGIRGAHPQDFRGAQMALMARVPRDDRAVADLAAYIQTLKPPQRMAAAASAP